MPLQIRRGTDAERVVMPQPLASGELLYVTDQQRLYIGDNTTIGGVPVTGFNAEDAIDAVGAALVAGDHTNIAFTYGATQDNAGRIDASVSISTLLEDLGLNSFDITGTGNIDIVGSVIATDFNGNIVADDTTVLVDTASNTVNLNGTISNHVLPSATGLHTLGSATYKFKDLFLSETINLAGLTLSSQSGSLIVDRIKADLEGSIFLNNSTRLIDGEQGNITTSGTITVGDLLIDSNKLVSTAAAPVGNRSDSPVYIGDETTPATVWQTSESNFSILTGLSDGTTNSGIEFRTSRGSIGTPLASQPGDVALFLEGKSFDGTDFVTSGFFGIGADPDATVSTGSAPGQFSAIVADASSNFIEMTFNSLGVLTAPIIKATGYATGSLPLSPEEGWMVFDSTTKEFKGWNGTAWVVLG